MSTAAAASASGRTAPGGSGRPDWVNPSGRLWMTSEDEDYVIYALRRFCYEHPECTAHHAIAALGLPDLASLPADKRHWTPGDRHIAREARIVQQHAEYAVRAHLRPPGPAPEASGVA